jgi:hypothetical protein
MPFPFSHTLPRNSLHKQITLPLPPFLFRITFPLRNMTMSNLAAQIDTVREEIVDQTTRLNASDEGSRNLAIVKARMELLIAVKIFSFLN